MRGEQFGFPAFGREFCEGVHDGRHATWCIARPDVQHPAHTADEEEWGEESTHEFTTFAHHLEGGHKGESKQVASWSWCPLRWKASPWRRLWYRFSSIDGTCTVGTTPHRGDHRPKGVNHSEPLTVLLPVWNESVVIEKKLDNLAAQSVPMSLVVIDSASTDATVDLVEGWLARHPSAFSSHEVLKMPTRKGKTVAVVQALEHIGQHREGLVCMTDADALLKEGVLFRMMQWFADPMIGAVGALPNRQHAREEEQEHRRSWDAMRLAESMVDSTPFLEGSCMMWRPSNLAIDDLNVGANADDAQIATSVRTRGWRSIVDSKARFVDAAPATVEQQRRQKIRRAQGLQRLLIRQRKRHGQNAGHVCQNHAPAIPLSHHGTARIDHRGVQRCDAMGIHRTVRLASNVHACQQFAPWFHCA